MGRRATAADERSASRERSVCSTRGASRSGAAARAEPRSESARSPERDAPGTSPYRPSVEARSAGTVRSAASSPSRRPAVCSSVGPTSKIRMGASSQRSGSACEHLPSLLRTCLRGAEVAYPLPTRRGDRRSMLRHLAHNRGILLPSERGRDPVGGRRNPRPLRFKAFEL